MWRNDSSPVDLRELLPDVALKMESDVIHRELISLGLMTLRRNGRKITRFEIQMNPNHQLILAPTDKGPLGYAEWMTWHSHSQEEDCANQLPYYSIRAHVQVYQIKDGERVQTASFTVHDNSVENLIRNAIAGVKTISGEKLTPVLRKSR